MIESSFDLQAELVKSTASTYFMRVGSDAMTADGILIGDKIVVDKAKAPKHKDIVVAVVDGQFLVRRLHHLDGLLQLRASNEYCQGTPIADLSQIWGVVVGVARKY